MENRIYFTPQQLAGVEGRRYENREMGVTVIAERDGFTRGYVQGRLYYENYENPPALGFDLYAKRVAQLTFNEWENGAHPVHSRTEEEEPAHTAVAPQQVAPRQDKAVSYDHYAAHLALSAQNPKLSPEGVRQLAGKLPGDCYLATQEEFAQLGMKVRADALPKGYAAAYAETAQYFNRPGGQAAWIEDANRDELQKLASGEIKTHETYSQRDVMLYDIRQTDAGQAKIDAYTSNAFAEMQPPAKLQCLEELAALNGIPTIHRQSCLPVGGMYDANAQAILVNDAANPQLKTEAYCCSLAHAITEQTSSHGDIELQNFEQRSLNAGLCILADVPIDSGLQSQLQESLQRFPERVQDRFAKTHRILRDVHEKLDTAVAQSRETAPAHEITQGQMQAQAVSQNFMREW